MFIDILYSQRREIYSETALALVYMPMYSMVGLFYIFFHFFISFALKKIAYAREKNRANIWTWNSASSVVNNSL